MSSFEEAFGVTNLNAVVETYANHPEQNSLLTKLFRAEEANSETYEWDEIEYARRLAPVSAPNAPSKNVVEMGRTRRSCSLAHVKINKRLEGRKIFQIERGIGQMQPNAEAKVAREVKEMFNTIQHTIEYMCSKVLAGSLVVSSANIEDTDVAFTVTFAVQTWTATASWLTAGTKILSGAAELPKVKDEYSQTTGFPLAMAIFNQTVANGLMGNTEVQAWVQHTQRGVEIFDVGMISNMAGLKWLQYDGHYKPTGGSVTKFVADDKVIFLPEQSIVSQYAILALGRGMIPKTAIGGLSAGLIGEAPSAGFYSYATIETDPVALKLMVGWIGLPVLTYPSVVKYGDVTP